MKVVFLLLCLACGPAFAQCVFPVTPTSWPTAVSFQPPVPIAGEPVTMVLGPETNLYVVDPQISVVAGTIVASAELSTIDFLPPPPSIRHVPIGAFAAGTYPVSIRLTEPTATCSPITTTLTVLGGAPVDLPAVGTPMTIVLLLALIAIVVPRLRRRRGDETR